jgi:hypothetical protein
MFLRNGGVYLEVHKALLQRIPTSTSQPLREHQISSINSGSVPVMYISCLFVDGFATRSYNNPSICFVMSVHMQ